MNQASAFLSKSANRVFVASVVGIAITVLEGVILSVILQTWFPGSLRSNPYSLENILSSFQFAYFPPFIPALLAPSLLTRARKEGAVAGFVTYLFLAVVATYLLVTSPQPAECHFCGLDYIVFALTPFLGAVVGAIGGAIGAWRVRRHERREASFTP
jgi:Na+/proline symporter